MKDFFLFIRNQAELLQYVIFFGLMAGFAILETYQRARLALSQRRVLANINLTILNILLLGAVPFSAIQMADLSFSHGWGILNLVSLPLTLAFIIGFLARSLIAYSIHWAMHKIPLFWRLHRVHHTDTAMDISTTVRFHPLETLVSIPVILAMIASLGIPPEAIILYEIVDAGMAVFTHAHVGWPKWLEKTLSYFIVTPTLHRIHHSSFQPQTNSNYGVIFPWWDWLFGTYQSQPSTHPLGLKEYTNPQISSLLWLLAMPFHPTNPVSSLKKVS